MPPDTNAEIRQRIAAGLEHLHFATEQLESAMARLDERLRVHDHLIGKMQAASARRASIRVARDIAGEVAARLLDDAEPPGSRGDKRPRIRRVHSK